MVALLKFLLTVSLSFLFSFKLYSQAFQCSVKGLVVGRESKNLLLSKATEDKRKESTIIPIHNGKFEYQFTAGANEVYELIFEEELTSGVWKPVKFFSEKGKVIFTLHPTQEFDKNRIEGGILNQKLQQFNQTLHTKFYGQAKPLQDSLSVLIDRGNYFSEAAKEIKKQIANTGEEDAKRVLYRKLEEMGKNHEDKSPEAKALKDSQEEVYKEIVAWRYQYIEANPSEVSYYFLFEDISQLAQLKYLSIVNIRKNYERLAKLYPKHPYSALVGQMIASYEAVRVGGDFIDFTAPDLGGNARRLSEIVKEKVTLIDLWASWCGPCIKTSRTIVPVYEEFKDKGFAVVGVAREFKNTAKLEQALGRENFPWLNLVELDDQNDIWLKYNIPFSGGGTFLLDKAGKILVINPTAAEVRKILNEIL